MQPPTIPKPTFHDVITGPFWRRQWLTIFSSIILLAGTTTFMWMAFMSVPDTLGTPFALSSVALLFCVQVYIIVAIWRRAYRRTAWYHYSQTIGGTYGFETSPRGEAFVFQRGAYRQISDQITNPTDLPFSAFGNYSYSYYIEYQYSALPLLPRKISFFELPLPRHLPHIILDSKKNNFLRRYSEYGLEIEGMQRLELEGDFINYFSLYVPVGYERDALYLFSPNIMSLLVQYAADCDVEIIDDRLYLFAPGFINITDTAKLAHMTQIGTAFMDTFSQGAARYSDALVGNRKMDVIAPAGSRLKRRAFPLVIVAAIVYLICMLYS